MILTKHDWIIFLYNVAVVITGVQAVLILQFEDRFSMMLLAIVFALFWTIYFRWGMIGRFADHPKLVEKVKESE